MAILQKTDRKPEIDISGPAGNAFSIMGQTMRLCRQMKIDSGPIIEEMMSGDYENLIAVFDREFGEYINLVR